MPRLTLFCECRQWFYRLAGQLNKWYLAKTMGFFHVRTLQINVEWKWIQHYQSIPEVYSLQKNHNLFSFKIFLDPLLKFFWGPLCFLFSPLEKMNWELWKLRLSLPGGGSCEDGHITIGRHFHNIPLQMQSFTAKDMQIYFECRFATG